MARYGLGHYNTPVAITFKTDKNGKRRAYRSHAPGHRLFPIPMDLAEAIVAAGEAMSVASDETQYLGAHERDEGYNGSTVVAHVVRDTDGSLLAVYPYGVVPVGAEEFRTHFRSLSMEAVS